MLEPVDRLVKILRDRRDPFAASSRNHTAYAPSRR
jgi:hypothetical protein